MSDENNVNSKVKISNKTLIINFQKVSEDKDFSFMKLINEIKKESGISINLATEIQAEKAPKLKFEPNINLKRTFIPNLEPLKKDSSESPLNLINLNQSIIK